MQREVLHPLNCSCSHCREPARQAEVDRDVAAILFGLVAGIAFGALIAACQFVPTLIEWIRAL